MKNVRKGAGQAPGGAAAQERVLFIARASHGGGWILRLPERVRKTLQAVEGGSESSEFFGDSKAPGATEEARRQASKQAAICRRDHVFRLVGLPVRTIKTVTGKAAKRSVTGLVGVAPGYRTSARGERYVGRWVAMDAGEGNTQFSVIKLGMREAFRRAVDRRQSVTGVRFTLGEIKAALRVVRALPAPQRPVADDDVMGAKEKGAWRPG